MSERPDPQALPGGGDLGARREGDTVVRVARPWTPSVHLLLQHLAERGFTGSPRPLGLDAGHERLTHLPGEVVGDRRPWPCFVHTDEALAGVARWLAAYHRAVADFVPPPDAVWREQIEPWRPGLVIAHNDAAPYNCVWDDGRVVGFVDWDMAGPRSVEDDVAWVAFSWVPLHARHVVEAEGFREFDRRRERLATFLEAYGWSGSVEEALDRVARVVRRQVELMSARAAAGDQTYRRMVDLHRDDDLRAALAEAARLRRAN